MRGSTMIGLAMVGIILVAMVGMVGYNSSFIDGEGLRDSTMRDYVSGFSENVNFTIRNPFNHTVGVYRSIAQTFGGYTLWDEWDLVDTVTGTETLNLTPGLYLFRVQDDTDQYPWDSWDNVEEKVWVYPGGTEFLDLDFETTQTAQDEPLWIWERDWEGVF